MVEFVGGPHCGSVIENVRPMDFRPGGGLYVLRESDLRDGSGTSDRMHADWRPGPEPALRPEDEVTSRR